MDFSGLKEIRFSLDFGILLSVNLVFRIRFVLSVGLSACCPTVRPSVRPFVSDEMIKGAQWVVCWKKLLELLYWQITLEPFMYDANRKFHSHLGKSKATEKILHERFHDTGGSCWNGENEERHEEVMINTNAPNTRYRKKKDSKECPRPRTDRIQSSAVSLSRHLKFITACLERSKALSSHYPSSHMITSMDPILRNASLCIFPIVFPIVIHVKGRNFLGKLGKRKNERMAS